MNIGAAAASHGGDRGGIEFLNDRVRDRVHHWVKTINLIAKWLVRVDKETAEPEDEDESICDHHG